MVVVQVTLDSVPLSSLSVVLPKRINVLVSSGVNFMCLLRTLCGPLELSWKIPRLI